MIKGLAHIALFTDKFEETIEFYKNVLQAVEIDRFRTSKNGCILQIKDFCLEILESKDFVDNGCFKHIAIECDNVDEEYNNAISKGAKAHIAPKDMDLRLYKRIAFVKGLNNEEIEFCEAR